jgi:hypothetical protein
VTFLHMLEHECRVVADCLETARCSKNASASEASETLKPEASNMGAMTTSYLSEKGSGISSHSEIKTHGL